MKNSALVSAVTVRDSVLITLFHMVVSHQLARIVLVVVGSGDTTASLQ